MEHNSGNQNMPPPTTLCRMGCGFYGNSNFEGMCSKCYKDYLKRRQQNPSPTQLAGRTSPPGASSLLSTPVSSSLDTSGAAAAAVLDAVRSSAAASIATTTDSVSTMSMSSPASVDTSKAPNVDTGLPTVQTTSSPASSQDKEQASTEEGSPDSPGAASVASSSDSSSSDKEKKPKKNRCHTCKKKVGLTGFECRCGGLYCSMHRYSDKHSCTFNYKELAQAQIRKSNPVIVAEKVQKI